LPGATWAAKVEAAPGRNVSASQPNRIATGSTGLTRQVVVDAAIALVDDRGLDGLSMRNLGAALGVNPMTIYGYVANKAELLDTVVEHVATQLRDQPPSTATDPVDVLVEASLHHRRVLLQHPNLAGLVAARPLPQADWAATVAGGIALLRLAGVPEDRLAVAASSLARFILGFILHEASESGLRAQLGEDDARYRDRFRAQADVFGRDTPEADALLRRIDRDRGAEEFDQGLRALVRGFAISG